MTTPAGKPVKQLPDRRVFPVDDVENQLMAAAVRLRARRFHGFLRQRMQVLQDEFAKNGQEGPFAKWLESWDPEIDLSANRVTTRIECAKYFQQRDEALLAHATQIDPKSFFFTTPMEWQQRLWPTEEFELARSRVPVSLPETDLFTGIEGRN